MWYTYPNTVFDISYTRPYDQACSSCVCWVSIGYYGCSPVSPLYIPTYLFNYPCLSLLLIPSLVGTRNWDEPVYSFRLFVPHWEWESNGIERASLLILFIPPLYLTHELPMAINTVLSYSNFRSGTVLLSRLMFNLINHIFHFHFSSLFQPFFSGFRSLSLLNELQSLTFIQE